MGETKIFALKGISLTIQEGEMVAIMGSSGSGKSSLLNILGCLDKPTGGTYYLDGENVSQLDKNQLAVIRNKRLGFVFQGFNLLGRVSVLANIQLPMVYAGAGKKDMADRAKEALEWVGLSKYLYHYPSQMSGGQQQRVAIARALVNNPSLILAGILTGIAGAKMISKLSGWSTYITTYSIVLSAGFSAAIGVFFGYYPAKKAAGLDPIEALRFEK